MCVRLPFRRKKRYGVIEIYEVLAQANATQIIDSPTAELKRRKIRVNGLHDLFKYTVVGIENGYIDQVLRITRERAMAIYVFE